MVSIIICNGTATLLVHKVPPLPSHPPFPLFSPSSSARDGKHEDALQTLATLRSLHGSLSISSLPSLILNLGTTPKGFEYLITEFRRLVNRNDVAVPEKAFCAMINLLASQGDIYGCLDTFVKLKEKLLTADRMTYLNVIKACLLQVCSSTNYLSRDNIIK